MLDELNDTVTVETGAVEAAVTVRFAVPVIDPLVPVMTALPAATPVTTPDAETVAIAVLELLHVTVPDVTLPVESVSVAVACVVVPTVMLAAASDTATLVGGGGITTRSAVPGTLSTVAVTLTVP